MGASDLLIVLASLVGLVAFAGWLAARQRAAVDYYPGGRHPPAWALGTSLAANQVSAVSIAGLVRFPLVATYCFFGLLLAGFLAMEPDAEARRLIRMLLGEFAVILTLLAFLTLWARR